MGSTVFVVDDERFLTDTVAKILRAGSFQAYSFYDPEDALRAAAETRPDLLLSDYDMPKMNGIQLAAAVRGINKDCRVIIMSGVTHSLGPAELGAGYRFLQKPILPRTLLDEVRSALADG